MVWWSSRGLVGIAIAVFLTHVAVRAGADTALQPSPDTSQLLVFLQGTQIGDAESTVKKIPEGWSITGSGRLSPPLDLTTRRLIVRYDETWNPIDLDIDAASRNSSFSIHTAFTGTTAENDIVKMGAPSKKTDTVSRDTLVLPNLFFPAYEALAIRLAAMPEATATMAAYVAPQAEIRLETRRLDVQVIETSRGTVRAHRYAVVFHNPGAPLPAEVWTDDGGRLLQFEVPSQALVVIRDDIGAVTARRQNITRPGDEAVQIRANGFNLAGTVSRPAGSGNGKGRYPAVVLVAGSGPIDRDETVAGIPVFGQLAGALGDAGYLVLRYDKRGVGQSGGRGDSADLYDYAEDARAAFRYVRDRKDVDDERIALFGHSEGGLVALVTATREDDVAALVLAATPSGTGAELVLEQQQYLLGTMPLPQSEKEARVALQKRIQAAVLGKGDWRDVPPDLRRQADTQWFRTFLAFSPASVTSKVDQPILILQGELDTQVRPYHADRLAELARARKKRPAESVQVVKLPRINHLLVPADTGDVAEYPRLAGRSVSPEVIKATTAWLGKVLAKR